MFIEGDHQHRRCLVPEGGGCLPGGNEIAAVEIAMKFVEKWFPKLVAFTIICVTSHFGVVLSCQC